MSQPIPNAYDINPRLMEDLKYLKKEEALQFIMSNQELVPRKYKDSINKAGKNIFLTISSTLVVGTVLNIFAKKVISNFFQRPTIQRVGIRLGLFGIPLMIGVAASLGSYKKINEQCNEVWLKARTLTETGDIKAYLQSN